MHCNAANSQRLFYNVCKSEHVSTVSNCLLMLNWPWEFATVWLAYIWPGSANVIVNFHFGHVVKVVKERNNISFSNGSESKFGINLFSLKSLLWKYKKFNPITLPNPTNNRIYFIKIQYFLLLYIRRPPNLKATNEPTYINQYET